ncbi:MAG: GNAT family N-acetyltransferase [Alphaproteobacteria bacterium]|nr:GNAT family N-acetyltransferase [Alphaproteobacteria bacterium]
MLSIRPYDADDLDHVITIFQRAIREVASKDYDAAQIAAWSAVDRQEWADHRLSRPTWVAEMDGRPAGFTDFEADGHLDMMFVHPDFLRRGVATALLRLVETAARAQGTTRIFTEASITARPFFLRRGFRLVAAQAVRCNGQTLTNFRMEKTLGIGAWPTSG